MPWPITGDFRMMPLDGYASAARNNRKAQTCGWDASHTGYHGHNPFFHHLLAE